MTPLKLSYGALVQITIHADGEKVNNSRSIYTSLDFLGDVGGLLEGLKMFFTPLFYFISQND